MASYIFVNKMIYDLYQVREQQRIEDICKNNNLNNSLNVDAQIKETTNKYINTTLISLMTNPFIN